MTTLIKQSTAVTPIRFLMVLSSDHVSPATGLSPTVTLSKNGGAFGSPAGAVTELTGGWYKVAPHATDSNTLGPIDLHATAATADPTDMADAAMVVSFDPTDAVRMGLTAMPNAAAGANTGLPVVGTQIPNATAGANNGLPLGDANAAVKVQAGTGTGQLDFTAGVVKSNLWQMLGTALTESLTGRVVAGFKKFFDIAAPSSTMNQITLVDTVTTVTNDPGAIATAAIKAKTDNLPSDPADASDIAAATNAIATAIAALNNLSQTQAQAAAAAALTAAAGVAIPSSVQIVDKLLGRNQKGGADGPSGQTVADALASGLMEFSIDANTNVLTMKNGDGTTAFTRTLTRAQLNAIITSS